MYTWDSYEGWSNFLLISLKQEEEIGPKGGPGPITLHHSSCLPTGYYTTLTYRYAVGVWVCWSEHSPQNTKVCISYTACCPVFSAGNPIGWIKATSVHCTQKVCTPINYACKKTQIQLHCRWNGGEIGSSSYTPAIIHLLQDIVYCSPLSLTPVTGRDCWEPGWGGCDKI